MSSGVRGLLDDQVRRTRALAKMLQRLMCRQEHKPLSEHIIATIPMLLDSACLPLWYSCSLLALEEDREIIEELDRIGREINTRFGRGEKEE